MRIEDTSNGTNKNIHPASNLSYLRIFGLDRVINSTGLTGKDDLVDNPLGVIDYERGYLMFPWYEPFNPPPEVVAGVSRRRDRSAGDRFQLRLRSSATRGSTSALTRNDQGEQSSLRDRRRVLERPARVPALRLRHHRGERGRSPSTGRGSRATPITTIDYTSGTVTLKTNILPDSKVNIDYQHKPLVGGGKNSLLGFSANLNLSQNSRINGTFLYSSMGSPKYSAPPRRGAEPHDGRRSQRELRLPSEMDDRRSRIFSRASTRTRRAP